MPFGSWTTHEVSNDSAALSPADFHQWIEDTKFVVELFGEKYTTNLLKNVGDDFIKYLADKEQLRATHAG